MGKTVTPVCWCIVLTLSWHPYVNAEDDNLGRMWTGCEYEDCSWHFKWLRKPASKNFSGQWRHRTFGQFKGTLQIHRKGDSIQISRPPLAGGPACRYSGQYRPGNPIAKLPARAYGTYTCGDYTGPWRATIEE